MKERSALSMQLYDMLLEHSKSYDEEFYNLITKYKDFTIGLLNIEREQKKPRKDYASFSEVKVPPTPKGSNNTTKYIIIALVIVVIVLVASLAYFAGAMTSNGSSNGAVENNSSKTVSSNDDSSDGDSQSESTSTQSTSSSSSKSKSWEVIGSYSGSGSGSQKISVPSGQIMVKLSAYPIKNYATNHLYVTGSNGQSGGVDWGSHSDVETRSDSFTYTSSSSETFTIDYYETVSWEVEFYRYQ